MREDDFTNLEKLYHEWKSSSYLSKKYNLSENAFFELYPAKFKINEFLFLEEESKFLLNKNKFSLDLIAINYIAKKNTNNKADDDLINNLWSRFPTSKYLTEAFFINPNNLFDKKCKANYLNSFFNSSNAFYWEIFYYDKDLKTPISQRKLFIEDGSSPTNKIIKIDIVNENVDFLRVDPLAKSNIILKNISLYSLNKKLPVKIHSTSGMKLNNNMIISEREHYDPHFTLDISSNNTITNLELVFDIAYLDMDLNKCE